MVLVNFIIILFYIMLLLVFSIVLTYVIISITKYKALNKKLGYGFPVPVQVYRDLLYENKAKRLLNSYLTTVNYFNELVTLDKVMDINRVWLNDARVEAHKSLETYTNSDRIVNIYTFNGGYISEGLYRYIQDYIQYVYHDALNKDSGQLLFNTKVLSKDKYDYLMENCKHHDNFLKGYRNELSATHHLTLNDINNYISHYLVSYVKDVNNIKSLSPNSDFDFDGHIKNIEEYANKRINKSKEKKVGYYFSDTLYNYKIVK